MFLLLLSLLTACSQFPNNFKNYRRIPIVYSSPFLKPSIIRSDLLVPLTIESQNKLGGIYPHSYISLYIFYINYIFLSFRFFFYFIFLFLIFHGLHCDWLGSHPGWHGSHPGSHDSHPGWHDSHGSLARTLVRLLRPPLVMHQSM